MNLCIVEGCGRRNFAYGHCSMHHKRVLRYGEPLPTRLDRFMTWVEKTDSCWVWTGHLHSASGYGRFSYGPRGHQKKVYAHRFAYEEMRGPILDGLCLDHICRNTRCVNPDHLQPVTQRENIIRGIGTSATNQRKNACKHGHPFDEANTYWRPTGGRTCKACARRRAKA